MYMKDLKHILNVIGVRLVELMGPVLSDKLYLKWKWRFKMGGKLDLENPKTFNEKLQWLKLYDRKPEYTTMVDKVKVKDYVAEKIGLEYLIPTIGVWNTPEEIDFESLPNQFVLKCSHNSGGLFICKDKSKVSESKWKSVLEGLRKSLRYDYYKLGREWPYKNVERKIIAEQYMVDESGCELKDYKFFCFNGKVEYCKVDFDRFVEHRANYYNPEWSMQLWGEECCPPKFDRNIQKAVNFDKMIELAQQLAKDIPFARIDFYNIAGRTYFGEITFFPAAGMGKFTSIEIDENLGKLIILPNRGGAIIDNQNIILHIHSDYSIPNDLTDYKFFCFGGVPKYVLVATDRSSDVRFDFFDMDFNHAPFKQTYDKLAEKNIEKPVNFDTMVEIARVLSKNIPHVRVDLYNINGKIYFGEMTFFNNSGFEGFVPKEWDKQIGDLIKLD